MMNIEPKKRYITDREEPSYDIRNTSPEVIDDIEIIGDIAKIMDEKQFKYLIDKHIISECGNDGQVSYIKLQHLFTTEDVKNKIKKICEENI